MNIEHYQDHWTLYTLYTLYYQLTPERHEASKEDRGAVIEHVTGAYVGTDSAVIPIRTSDVTHRTHRNVLHLAPLPAVIQHINI